MPRFEVEMKVLFINKVFPNPVEPTKGNFVLKNLMHYPQKIELEVIAPVPFFLSLRRQRKARVPLSYQIELGGRRVRIWHPRFALFPRNFLQAWIPSFEYWSLLPLVWYLHKRQRIDCLHANFCLPDGIATSKLARKLHIPYLITEHQAALAELLSKPELKRMMLAAYFRAHKVIAVSEYTAQLLLNAGLSKAKVAVVPNGIDTDLFVHSEHFASIRKLIYVGYLVERKGLQYLLKALSILKDSSVSLSIVGDGDYRDELEQLCSKYDLKDSVVFLGEKNAQQVAHLLSEHDALVHPSLIESFGIVVVEAMASGLPVLATQNGGSEYIVTPQSGIIVPARDAQALADGIRALIKTEWDTSLISEYAQNKYDIRQVVSETIKLYPVKKPSHTVCHLTSVHIRTDVRVYYKQCLSLVRAGYKVHLVVADGKGNQHKDGVIIHDTGHYSKRFQRFILGPLKVFFKAMSIPADAYQIHDPELLPMALLLRYLKGKPVIYDIHECYAEAFLHKDYLSPMLGRFLSSAIKYLERSSLCLIDGGISATEHIAEQFKGVPIVHNYPILAEWGKVESNIERYQSRNICYIGNITRERGIGQIVKAIADVDCQFHLAGRYEPAQYRDELLALPGFAKVIEYGYVNRGKAADIFAKCALGVVLFDRSPNHLYSLSTKMFEYMAAGLPVLVSDLPTNVDLIDQSGSGKYLDPTRIDLIAKMLDQLLNDPDSLSEMGHKGKSLVTEQLSWENEQDLYLNIYADLLS